MTTIVEQNYDIQRLAWQVKAVDRLFKEETAKAVNRNLTARNWLIGYYIVNYEQQGCDRAQYGEQVLKTLADRLAETSLSYENLKVYRRFYIGFPELSSPIRNYIVKQPQLQTSLLQGMPQLAMSQIGDLANPQLAMQKIGDSKSTQLQTIEPELLFSKLSFSHLRAILPVKDPLKRAFYELECMKGVWSVQELKRQMNTNYYERTALSRSPEKMSVAVQQHAEKLSLAEVVKSPHVYEFLGLKDKEIVEESDLEQALMNHLQDFLLELGQGFCFEARQKRLLIDDEYFYCDLVFYHRVLKCHVIVELKAHKFSYTDLAQLNMYVAYYKKNMMQTDDNPPIGILLCTDAGPEQVEYATAGMDQQLFVSKYLLRLPLKETLANWINSEIERYNEVTNNDNKI